MVRRLPEAKKSSLVKILNHRDIRVPQRLDPVLVRNTQYKFTIDTFQDQIHYQKHKSPRDKPPLNQDSSNETLLSIE
jgi:hypothetical protein